MVQDYNLTFDELMKSERKYGRLRTKDYSKLDFPYGLQLLQGVYLIYNDTLGVCYPGKAHSSFAERFSVHEAKYQAFLRGEGDCLLSTKALFEHEDSRMEWLFIPETVMTKDELATMEKLCIQHFDYHCQIINKDKPKAIQYFDENLMNNGYVNLDLFVKYGVMDKINVEVV